MSLLASSRFRDRPASVLLPEVGWSDQELVDAIIRGQREALGIVWDRYAALVRSVLRSSIGPQGAIEELLQDVFMDVLRGARGMRNRAALRSFLIAAAVRAAAQQVRRHKVRRWVRLTESSRRTDPMIPPPDCPGQEALLAFYRHLDAMSSRRRFAFVLYHVQELELHEVALALGTSQSTVQREATRAREQLRLRAARDPALRGYTEISDWHPSTTAQRQAR